PMGFGRVRSWDLPLGAAVAGAGLVTPPDEPMAPLIMAGKIPVWIDDAFFEAPEIERSAAVPGGDLLLLQRKPAEGASAVYLVRPRARQVDAIVTDPAPIGEPALWQNTVFWKQGDRLVRFDLSSKEMNHQPSGLAWPLPGIQRGSRLLLAAP